MTRRLRIACWSIASGAVAAGLAIWWLPPRLSVPAIMPAVGKPTQDPVLPAVDAMIAEEIAVANVFAASRTPPSRRYAPPEFGGDSANGMMGDGAGDSEPAPDSLLMDGSVPRLYGTVIGATGTSALLQLDPSALGPRLYDVGERGFGYSIVTITPRRVVLLGKNGRVTLRLDPEENRP